MDNDPFGLEAFSRFPVWTVVVAPEYRAKGLPSGLVIGGSPGYGPIFPLFTDRDRAVCYAASAEGKEFEPYPIPDAARFLQLLSSVTNIGVEYVGVDRSSATSIDAPTEGYIPIRVLVAMLEGLQPEGG